MRLGDARSGKLADNITGFGRALRRAGVPADSARMALATQAAELVGVVIHPDPARPGIRRAIEAPRAAVHGAPDERGGIGRAGQRLAESDGAA